METFAFNANEERKTTYSKVCLAILEMNAMANFGKGAARGFRKANFVGGRIHFVSPNVAKLRMVSKLAKAGNLESKTKKKRKRMGNQIISFEISIICCRSWCLCIRKA